MFLHAGQYGVKPPLYQTPAKAYVWCEVGLQTVLASGKIEALLSDFDDARYFIDFGNMTFIEINPSDPTWEVLKKFTDKYDVQVFSSTYVGKWVEWTGHSDDVNKFDGVLIKNKKKS